MGIGINTKKTPDIQAASRAFWSGKVNAEHRHADEHWFERYAQELLALMPSGGTLFDVGCGSCQVTTYLASAYDRIVAFDFSASMISAARQRVNDRKLPHITVASGEATRFPDGSGQANVILTNGVIQYLDDAALEMHLAECSRVLSPGGTVCWSLVPNAHLRWLWYSGTLTNPRPPFVQRLRRRLRMTVRCWIGRRRKSPLWDGIGHWFTQEALRAKCEAAGFTVEFRNCWFYEYRFHVLLRRTVARPS